MGWMGAVALLLVFLQGLPETEEIFFSGDVRYWRCIWKQSNSCPDDDIKMYLYTRKGSFRTRAEVTIPGSLQSIGWDRRKDNVIIIHGHNGTDGKAPLSYLRDAFLSRGDFNVFFVDWGLLTRFPCYFSALNNMKLVSQCTAQLYAHLTHQGALMKRIICIGHSLGAHICGMIANYSTMRPSRILALDPARPIINDVSSPEFRLTSDDADFVEVIHTNAGVLGTDAPHGTVDFCINGGQFQPQCSSIINPIRRHRCSHFQGICLISSIVGSRKRRQVMGYPCLPSCPMQKEPSLLLGKPVPMGMAKPIPGAKGTYCVKVKQSMCPYL